MIRKLSGWILLLVVLAGCADSAAPDPSRMGYQYYPLAVGDYRDYYVTDIRFRFDQGDTSRFLMREVVKSTFTDQTNTLNYRMERFIRPDSSSPWRADSVFLVSKSLTNVIHTKDNTKRVKMVFPVRNGKTWFGDAYNDILVHEEKEPYTYASVHEPFEFNNSKLIYNNTGIRFDSSATVIQGEPHESVTSLDDRKEVYAAGVGMVYRLFKRAVLCSPSDETSCEHQIIEGHERHEVLIGHGNH